MAIISASRKTDIPTYYSEWFLRRLEAGEFYVRNNPYKPEAVSHITFKKEDIDCIVFWTKNAIPMMDKLHRLDGYQYYFQYTLTGYGSEVEKQLPVHSERIQNFRELAIVTGSKAGCHPTKCRVVWRYDPIIFTSDYTMEWHLKTFQTLATALAGFTDKCVISFVDLYGFVGKQMRESGLYSQNKSREMLLAFCSQLAEIARSQGMSIYTCAEEIALEETGILHGSCIDKKHIEALIGYELNVKKDKGQRSLCGCVESMDIGKYNTCVNGCKYCYACNKPAEISRNLSLYKVDSPILCDALATTDIITEKHLQSFRSPETFNQLSLF